MGYPEIPQKVKDLRIELDQVSKVVIGTDYQAINLELISYTAQGYKIKFKRQIYEITGTIVIPNGSEIDWNNCGIIRKAGYKGFDLIKSENTSKLKLNNLLIDGNKNADNLSNANAGDRFAGLRLKNVTDSDLKNISVINTCSGEI